VQLAENSEYALTAKNRPSYHKGTAGKKGETDMKKRSALLLAALLSLALLGCAKEAPRVPTVGDASETVLTADAPMVLETTEATYPADVQSVTVRVTNPSGETYMFGRSFVLEIFSGDQWCTLTPAPSDKTFTVTDEGIFLSPDKPAEVTDYLEYYGTQFPPGRYRIVREFWSEGGGETVIAAVEFEIAE
jgi:hypothetical protein